VNGEARATGWWGRGELAPSLVLIVPLFLAYQVGVLFTGNVNGADVVTRAAYGALGRQTYLLVNAGIAVAFLLWVRRHQRWTVLRLSIVMPIVLEAAIYALLLGTIVVYALDRFLGLALAPGSVVNALGAGVHEELVFRLALFGGLVALLWRVTERRHVAVFVALVASSVAFSAAHHLGTYGEPYSDHAFAFRCVAGFAFGLAFWFRSLAHAVYAHALYDVLVYWRG
jgi:hypothetical protein